MILSRDVQQQEYGHLVRSGMGKKVHLTNQKKIIGFAYAAGLCVTCLQQGTYYKLLGNPSKEKNVLKFGLI